MNADMNTSSREISLYKNKYNTVKLTTYNYDDSHKLTVNMNYFQ